MRRFSIGFTLIILASCAPKTPVKDVSTKSAFIMNGKEVKASDKIATSIVGIYNTKYKEVCTGSLIAPNIVLTAAHCVPDRASNVKIIFSTDIDDAMNSREPDVVQALVLPATDFKVSPTWDPKNETVEVNTGDIALIKFKGAIPAGYTPATFLADTSALKIGNTVTVAGFGVNYVNMEEIDPKKYHNLEQAIEQGEIVCNDEPNGKHSQCYKMEKDGDGVLRVAEAPISFILDTEVRLNEKKAGTCNGDSGGPAYIQKDGVYYLFGVTSRGSDMCDDVGVYTNALTYKTWIADTIKILK